MLSVSTRPREPGGQTQSYASGKRGLPGAKTARVRQQSGSVQERRARSDWWTRPAYQLLALAVVVIVIAGLVVALATFGSPRNDTLEYDARNLAIQFLLLVGLGAVVTYLVDLERRARETREQRRRFEIETISSALDQLNKIFSSVKNSRRMLRVDDARGELDDLHLAKHLLRVNRDQEQAEQLRKRMEALDAQMAGLAAIANDVKALDDYLSDLWGNFEATPTRGPWLVPFIAPADAGHSDFEQFKRPYDTARTDLMRWLGVVSTKAR